jgi:hypothetical protein
LLHYASCRLLTAGAGDLVITDRLAAWPCVSSCACGGESAFVRLLHHPLACTQQCSVLAASTLVLPAAI